MTFDQFRFSDTWFPEFKQPLVTKSNFVKNYQFFQKEKEKKSIIPIFDEFVSKCLLKFVDFLKIP